MEAAVGRGTARPEDLRHGVRLAGRSWSRSAATCRSGCSKRGRTPRQRHPGHAADHARRRRPRPGRPEEQLIPIDRQERLTYARRLVAQRCLYGVDKNPLAVEMAKLSLWLLTLAKDKPFTFLDHAIRCGDSLVGLSSIDQLLRFSMTENAKVRPLMEQQRQQIEKRLQATMLLRKQIETQPSNTPQDIERKTLMFANVEDQTKRLTYAADMLLAATWEAKNVRRVGVGLERDVGRGRVQVQRPASRATG